MRVTIAFISPLGRVAVSGQSIIMLEHMCKPGAYIYNV